MALAGLGGVGGGYATTLARMGVGNFNIADFDHFEPANFNRQRGALISTLERPKAEVLREMILDINPHATVKIFSQGIDLDNLPEFLDGVNVVMDGLDAFAVTARREMYEACQQKNIHVLASGPVGLTATLHVFGPGSMSFEDYFDFRSCKTFESEIAAFIIGTCPSLLHFGQIDLQYVNFKEQRGPSFATAIDLCVGIACTEAMKILTNRGKPFLAPRYLQFDAYNLRLARKYLLWGNRNPLQRLKRWIFSRSYEKGTRKKPGTREQL